MTEIGTLFTQISNLNRFQRRHILDLTHGVVREGIMTDLQFSQSLTILQIEATVSIITQIMILLFEATVSNHHSLQLIQPNQSHNLHLPKATISDYQFSQLDKNGKIEHFTLSSITTAIAYDQFLNVIVKELILFIQHHRLLNLAIIIHPFSIKHHLSCSIILNASSPSYSFTPFSFILNHSNVRIVSSAIAHIHITHSESLIHHSVLTVIQHTPTIRLIIQHVAFPSLSIITQIQHLSVLNILHNLSIHSQQLTRLNIHFDLFAERHFSNHRSRLLNNTSMIPTQAIEMQHGETDVSIPRIGSILSQLLCSPFLHPFEKHFRIAVSSDPFNRVSHKGMLRFTSIHKHPHSSIHAQKLSPSHL